MVVDLGVGPVLREKERERERERGGAKVISADQYRRRSAASSVLQRPMLSYFLSKSNAIRCTHSEKIILECTGVTAPEVHQAKPKLVPSNTRFSADFRRGDV